MLALIGSAGLLLIVAALVLLPIFAHVSAPGIDEFLNIALHGLPFCFYLYAIRQNWTRQVALLFGVPVHLAWLPAIQAITPYQSMDDFLWTMAACAVFSVYVFYAFSLPKGRS